MEAIKKKMQAMKAEKENAVERAETAEDQAKEANQKAEKVWGIISSFFFIFISLPSLPLEESTSYKTITTTTIQSAV